ncbi:MAG: transporter substrate-binding domain-containing protein [Leptolyngbyaceae cyanobacterium CRU_2_3]|nr:transporter substrate-binding domain-containing protein [Leptolyngbyaceae cyanobacterium CRU_2_3]
MLLTLGLLALPAPAADLEAIVQRGYLVVGVKDNLRPLAFKGTQGQLEGLEIDLARHLAAELLGNSEAIVRSIDES